MEIIGHIHFDFVVEAVGLPCIAPVWYGNGFAKAVQL